MKAHSLQRSLSWGWLVLLSIVSCTSMPPAKDYETPGALRTELDGDVRTLNAVRPHLEALDDDFETLRKKGDWVERGYFSVAENDRMEHLLFRFLASHSALWDISAAYQNMQTSSVSTSRTRPARSARRSSTAAYRARVGSPSTSPCAPVMRP